jgi:hypothetical protein
MKQALRVLKIVALVVLAVAGVEGFFFFRVWQQDPQASDVTARWTTKQTLLGAPAVLRVEMNLPWHHRPASPNAIRVPDGWVAQEAGAWSEGVLDLTGFRHWSLDCKLVPVVASPASGGTIAWPLRATSGKPPRPVELVVPSLAINLPKELAAAPHNPSTPLEYHPPALAPVAAAAPSQLFYGLWLTVAVLVVAGASYVGHLFKRPEPEMPSWTRALLNLNRLASEPLIEGQAYCTRLTDILKEYATHRFECNLVATSSTEFLLELARRHSLASEDKQALQATLGHADVVRFAGVELAPDSAVAALDQARRFVINTTPPEPDRA